MEENKELMLFHQQEDSKATLSLSLVRVGSCLQPVWLQGSSNCTTLVHPEARNLPLMTWSHHIILEINFKIRRTDFQPDHSSVPFLIHLLLPNARSNQQQRGKTVLSNQPDKFTWTVCYRLEADTAQNGVSPKYTKNYVCLVLGKQPL